MDGYVYVNADAQFKKLLGAIFTDEFMKENTNFDNFEGFKYSSAVITRVGQILYEQMRKYPVYF